MIGRATTAAKTNRRRREGAVALVLLAGILTYANSLSGPFIFDDQASVVQNAQIRAVDDLTRTFSPPANTPLAGRPLVNISLAINYAVGGLDVSGYHVVNLALHLICGLLIFGLVRRTGELAARPPPDRDVRIRPEDAALAVALIWIVHPLNSEVVNYITQRTESMMAVCFLVTLYASVRGLRPGRRVRWEAAAVAACAAGMACKETMVVAPVMVVLYDRTFAFASFRAAFRARGRFYGALFATWALLLMLLLSHGQTTSAGFGTARADVWTYLLNQTVMLTRYLRLAVWPDALVVYYGWPRPLTLPQVWPYAAFIVLLLVATIVALVRQPRIGFLAAWIVITLAPASSFVPVATEVGAERRMYLPLVALIALAVMGAIRLARITGVSRRSAAALLILVSILLAGRTIARNREYGSALTLATTVLDRWPTPLAHNLVGTELAAAGRRHEAIPHLREAAQQYAPARFSLGAELIGAGQTDEGMRELQAFIREEPNLLATRAAHGLLANAYAARRDFGAAVPHYREYLAAHSTDADAWSALAVALVETRQMTGAVEAFRAAANLAPANPQLQLNLARALLDTGQLEEAVRIATHSAARLPTPGAHDILGRAAAARGRLDDARRHFERALQLDPTYAPAVEALRALLR